MGDRRESSSIFSGGIVQLVVELEGETSAFNVHEQLLFQCSSYFPAAFEGGFSEATTRKLVITDFLPETVLAFVDWLYFRKLPEWGEVDEGDEEDTELSEEPSSIGNLAVFSNRFQVLDLERQILEVTYERYACGTTIQLPSFVNVRLIFEKLPDSSKLQKLCVDLYAARWDEDWDEGVEKDMRSSIPPTFWMRLSIRLAAIRGEVRALPPLSEYGDSVLTAENRDGDEDMSV